VSDPADTLGRVLAFEKLAHRTGYRVSAVTCRDDRKGWSEQESPDIYRVVLVRRGRFRRRVAGVVEELDPTVAYVGTPHDEEHFAHPEGGDVCTLVSLTPTLWSRLAGEDARPARSTVYVDPRLDLAHRRVVAAARTGDVDDALTEDLVDLLGGVVEQVVAGPTPTGTRRPGGDSDLVASARRVIAEDHPGSAGLLPLAELLGVSPYRLSRAFTRELGVSLTRYRNRVRLGRALQRIEEGEPNLAALAAELGFADQAHLTRMMSAHLGRTPGTVRRLLASR
jgi:AraC-like DNA-binding protein